MEEAKPYAEQVLAAHRTIGRCTLCLSMWPSTMSTTWKCPQARGHLPEAKSGRSRALYYLGMIQKMEGDVKAAIQAWQKVWRVTEECDAQGALGALSLQAV